MPAAGRVDRRNCSTATTSCRARAARRRRSANAALSSGRAPGCVASSKAVPRGRCLRMEQGRRSDLGRIVTVRYDPATTNRPSIGRRVERNHRHAAAPQRLAVLQPQLAPARQTSRSPLRAGRMSREVRVAASCRTRAILGPTAVGCELATARRRPGPTRPAAREVRESGQVGPVPPIVGDPLPPSWSCTWWAQTVVLDLDRGNRVASRRVVRP